MQKAARLLFSMFLFSKNADAKSGFVAGREERRWPR
jgi:hypothetical protein